MVTNIWPNANEWSLRSNNRHWSLCRISVFAASVGSSDLLQLLSFWQRVETSALPRRRSILNFRMDRDMQIRLNQRNILLRRYCCWGRQYNNSTQGTIVFNLHIFGIFSIESIDRSVIVRPRGSLPPDQSCSTADRCLSAYPSSLQLPQLPIIFAVKIILFVGTRCSCSWPCEEGCNLSFSAAFFLSNVLALLLYFS